jgi:hypothetical protein
MTPVPSDACVQPLTRSRSAHDAGCAVPLAYRRRYPVCDRGRSMQYAGVGDMLGPVGAGEGAVLGGGKVPQSESRTGSASNGLPPTLNHSDVLWCPMSGL